MIAFSELERNGKEAVMGYLEVLTRISRGENERNQADVGNHHLRNTRHDSTKMI
jgi:hypothetical protein